MPTNAQPHNVLHLRPCVLVQISRLQFGQCQTMTGLYEDGIVVHVNAYPLVLTLVLLTACMCSCRGRYSFSTDRSRVLLF